MCIRDRCMRLGHTHPVFVIINFGLFVHIEPFNSEYTVQTFPQFHNCIHSSVTVSMFPFLLTSCYWQFSIVNTILVADTILYFFGHLLISTHNLSNPFASHFLPVLINSFPLRSTYFSSILKAVSFCSHTKRCFAPTV